MKPVLITPIVNRGQLNRRILQSPACRSVHLRYATQHTRARSPECGDQLADARELIDRLNRIECPLDALG